MPPSDGHRNQADVWASEPLELLIVAAKRNEAPALQLPHKSSCVEATVPTELVHTTEAPEV